MQALGDLFHHPLAERFVIRCQKILLAKDHKPSMSIYRPERLDHMLGHYFFWSPTPSTSTLPRDYQTPEQKGRPTTNASVDLGRQMDLFTVHSFIHCLGPTSATRKQQRATQEAAPHTHTQISPFLRDP